MAQPEPQPARLILASAGSKGNGHKVVIQRLQQSELFREYQLAFEATTGLPLVLREAGSFRPPLEGSKKVNPFCALMTQANATCAACLQFQQRVEAESTKAARTLECHAGLTETAVPVLVGGYVLGYLQTGQVFRHQPARRRFKAATRLLAGGTTAAAPPGWEAAYFRTRVVAPRQYRMIIRLLAVFAEHLGTISNRLQIGQTLGDTPLIKRLRAFVDEHHGEPLSLRDAARETHLSPFHLCKVFKAATGLTFTNYLARVRTEVVKDMLLDDNMRISEAAYAAGFQSLSQFNRVFHRITGDTPSRYRNRLHGRTGLGSRPALFPQVPGREHAPGASIPSRPRAALAVELYG